MQYLIYYTGGAFVTKWFEAEQHWNPETYRAVFDLIGGVFTTDGKTWNPIQFDHL